MRGMERGIAVAVIGVALFACKSPDRQPPGPERGAVPVDEEAAGKRPPAPPAPIARPAGVPVDLETLDLRRRAEVEALAFEEATERRLCFRPPAVDAKTIDPARSLFVHDRATIDALGPDTFSLRRTLAKIAADAASAGAAGVSAETVYRDLWDTQNDKANAATPEGAHCDDDGTTLNGFPNMCRLQEGAQAKAADLAAEIASYRPIALVNRIDLAAEGWKNCGEHRIVYGRVGRGVARSFLIFEAVLPNPRPGCQSGCRPVAEQWYRLSKIADPARRARELERFFYRGLPGFRPVVHVDHYAARGATSGYGGSGSGQIRTNQFLEQPWVLKELKLALDCTHKPCKLDVVPIPVKINPHGPLWIDTPAGLAHDFQQGVLAQVESLAINDLNTFTYQVPDPFNAARSESQFGGIADDYFEAYTTGALVPGGFRAQLQALVGSAVAPTLTDRHIVNRATALSCAGCHQPSTFGLRASDAIGPSMSWPDSAGFVHVRAEDDNGVHALSPALTDVFLPFRAQNLAQVLGEPVCLCLFRRPGPPIIPRDVLPRSPVKVEELREAEQRLKRQLDRDLVRQGKPRLPDLAVDLEAQPLILEEVRAAGPDERARSVARRRAVQRLVAEQPPRRTVTGHFRTH
jgi:hypothetical protein